MGKRRSIQSGLEDLFRKDGFIEQQKAAAIIADRVSKPRQHQETSLKSIPKYRKEKDHSLDHSDHSLDHSDHSLDHSDHSLDHSDHSFDHSQDHSQDHSATHKTTQNLNHSQDHSQDHSLNLFSAKWDIEHLTRRQQIVFKFIAENQQEIFSYEHISSSTNIPKNSVRTIIRRLLSLKMIKTERARNGVRQGLKISLQITPKSGPVGQDIFIDHSQDHSLFNLIQHKAIHETTHMAPHLHKKERKNYNSFFLNLNDSDLNAQFPLLKKIGFGVKQLYEIIESLQKFEKSPEHLLQGLQHAEAALEHDLLKVMSKSEVKDPLGYIFASLRKHGTFDRPPGWVSPEEKAIEEAARRIAAEKKRLAMLEELEAISGKADFLERFQTWKSNLSTAELEEIRRKLPGGGSKSLEVFFRTKVEGAG